MTNNTNKLRMILLLGGVLTAGLLTIIALSYFTPPKGSDTDQNSEETLGIDGDPADVLLDFYDLWFTARTASSSTTAKDPLHYEGLSTRVRDQLAEFDLSPTNTEIDPIYCQTVPSERLRTKTIYKLENEIQKLVFPKDSQESGQTIITLKRDDKQRWRITEFSCTNGEQGPTIGEFAFNNQGRLLKDSLPDTFNKQYWYLVYSRDDLQGLTAPLILNSDSICINEKGDETSCDTETFFETMSVNIQGQMSEAGVEVKRVELLP